MRTQILRFAFAATGFFCISTTACLAQSVAAPERAVAPPQRTPMRPGVRYTTGTYVVSGPGWEKQLTSGNPNLGHWNWIPVIGYTQSTGTTSKQAIHVSTPEHRSIYVKPTHIALPDAGHSTGKLATHANLPSAPIHLIKQEPAEGFNHAETKTQAVLSYAGDYHGTDGYRSSSIVRGTLAHKSVGAMLSQSVHY